MPSPLRIRVTTEEKQCLFELRANPKIPQRTKQRVEALLLSEKGWKVGEIADYLNCAYNTVRQTFYRWLTQGKEGLFDAPRSLQKASVDYGRPILCRRMFKKLRKNL